RLLALSRPIWIAAETKPPSFPGRTFQIPDRFQETCAPPSVKFGRKITTLAADTTRATALSVKRFTRVDAVASVEHGLEVVDVEEIAELVAFSLPHFSAIDEFEHDAAEVIGALNAPMTKNGERQQTEFLMCQVGDPVE